MRHSYRQVNTKGNENIHSTLDTRHSTLFQVKCFFLLFGFALFLLFFSNAVYARDLGQDFTFRSLDGRTIDRKSLAGSPLVMVVGAAWCLECRSQAREIQRAYDAYKDRGVVFIWVFGGSRDEEIKEFIEDYKLTFPVGKDNGIVEAFGVRAIPQTFFFSRDGKFIKRIIGPPSSRELSRYIEQALKQ